MPREGDRLKKPPAWPWVRAASARHAGLARLAKVGREALIEQGRRGAPLGGVKAKPARRFKAMQIKFSDQQQQQLDDTAAVLDCSRTHLIAEALQEYYIRHAALIGRAKAKKAKGEQ